MEKQNNGKAQGAMEYLMTYGWAILVVMVIGLALWKLGVFNLLSSPTITVSGFSKIRPLEPSVSFTPQCTFYGIFVNSAGNNVEIKDIMIEHQSDNTKCQYNFSGVGIAEAGDEIHVKYGNCCSGAHSPGEPYSLKIKINYTVNVVGNTVDRTDLGRIYGSYENISLPVVCKEWYYGTSQQGHCCSSPKICNPPFKLEAADCSECCEGPGNTHCI